MVLCEDGFRNFRETTNHAQGRSNVSTSRGFAYRIFLGATILRVEEHVLHTFVAACDTSYNVTIPEHMLAVFFLESRKLRVCLILKTSTTHEY